MKNKVCIKCKRELSLEDFYKSTNKGGYQNCCKRCTKKRMKDYYIDNSDKIKERQKEWNKNNKQHARDYSLNYRYGLTLEQYNDMFESQSGCCAICEIHQSELNKTLSVDHNHSTGEVRGLLCTACNQSLGKVKEDVNILNSMIEYIEKYS